MLRRRKGERNRQSKGSSDEGRQEGSDESELEPDEALDAGDADDVSDGADEPAADEPVAEEPDGEEPDGEGGALPRPPMEHLSDARLLFDCSAWSRDDRAELDAMLKSDGIDRVWQGPELVVSVLDEHLVEEALDDLGVGQATLPEGTAQVVYEVGEWPRVLRDSLAESLLVAGISAAWDEAADLHVAATDERGVDTILEAMPDPDEVFEEAEGTEVQDLLTQLYAAVDRLKDNPKHPGSRLDVVDAAERMDRLAVPFGFDAGQWRDLVERAGDLRDEIDEEILGAAEGADDAEDLDDAGDGAAEDGADEDEADGRDEGEAAVHRLPFAARAGQLRDRLVRLV
ncbi:MAG: hypothetical protein R2754_01160 [Microthrixaceae bacterium]